MGPQYGDAGLAVNFAFNSLKTLGQLVDAGRWQGIPTEGKPDLKTREILDLRFGVNLARPCWPDYEDWQAELAVETGCNADWADEHFAERVGGKGLNPDPSHERWPWWQGQDETTKHGGVFTHTYSERFWPPPTKGVRYQMANYDHLLWLLWQEPNTRQAYLPIFFPEDTGAVHGGRIPCTLGYHFLLREGKLHCWYDIRSCDAVRHFRDDLYLAARLVGHTIAKLTEIEGKLWADVKPGILWFTAHSFHVHMGDYHLLQS